MISEYCKYEPAAIMCSLGFMPPQNLFFNENLDIVGYKKCVCFFGNFTKT